MAYLGNHGLQQTFSQQIQRHSDTMEPHPHPRNFVPDPIMGALPIPQYPPINPVMVPILPMEPYMNYISMPEQSVPKVDYHNAAPHQAHLLPLRRHWFPSIQQFGHIWKWLLQIDEKEGAEPVGESAYGLMEKTRKKPADLSARTPRRAEIVAKSDERANRK